MFEKLDQFLVIYAQWIVRQIELFTPVTRWQVGSFLFTFQKLAIIAMSIFAVLVATDQSMGDIMLPFILFIFFCCIRPNVSNFKNCKKRFIEPATFSRYPSALHLTDKDHRLNYILSGMFDLLIVLFVVAFVGRNLVTFVLLLNFFVVCNHLIIEYFLCTQSVPPEEKVEAN